MVDFGDCDSTFGMCLEWGTFLAAAGVSFPLWVGLYLFRTGCDDFAKGCEEMMNRGNWVCKRLMFLKDFLPLTCLIRVFCAPAMWYYFSHWYAYERPPLTAAAVLWVVSFFVSWGLFAQVILLPGMSQVLSSHSTMDYWPPECSVNRPYHGLASTRCHALNGGFCAELLWTIWTVVNYSDASAGTRLAGITIPLVIFNAGMIFGGPVNFLSRNPNKDQGIAQAYILAAMFAVEGFILLNHAWFGIRQAINPVTNLSPLGPFGHWSVIAWFVILAAQILVCRTAIGRATELKPGAPWSAGGADHKEFFFPRFLGQIFFCQGMFVGFFLWVLGNWLWVNQGVKERGFVGS